MGASSARDMKPREHPIHKTVTILHARASKALIMFPRLCGLLWCGLLSFICTALLCAWLQFTTLRAANDLMMPARGSAVQSCNQFVNSVGGSTLGPRKNLA